MEDNRGTVRLLRAVRVLLGLAVLSLPVASEGRAGGLGRCVAATVPWTFELPDGSAQPPGMLTICLSRVHDPVTRLHEVRIGNRPVGMFMSRVGEAEAALAPSPVLVFAIGRRAPYRLVGYAWPGSEELETYRFYDPRADRQERLLARAPLLDSGTPPQHVLLAVARPR